MKNIKIDELNKYELLRQTEPISLEYKGDLIGYYYPINNDKESRVDEIEKQINLGREFMSEYQQTFQELAK